MSGGGWVTHLTANLRIDGCRNIARDSPTYSGKLMSTSHKVSANLLPRLPSHEIRLGDCCESEIGTPI